MKKLFYIIGIIAVIGIVGYLIFVFFFQKLRQGTGGNGAHLPQQGLLPQTPQNSIALTSITDQFPKTPTVKLGTNQGIVEVKNFYNALADTEEGSVILKNLDAYVIAYRRDTSAFAIELFSNSITVRQAAETDFLNILGIGQADACKLNVQVQTPTNQSGVENKNLSFCLNKL